MTRSTIGLTALGLILALGLAAEATATKSFTLGIKGGVSIGQAHGDDISKRMGVSKSSRNAIDVGMALGIPIAPELVLQPELLLASKGVEYTSSSFAAKATFKVSLLEFPLLLRWSRLKGTGFRPELFGGMFAAFPLSAHVVSHGFIVPRDGETDIIPDLNACEVGTVLGIGAALRRAKVEYTLEFRWDYGINDLMQTAAYGAPIRAKTTTLLVMAGVRFPL